MRLVLAGHIHLLVPDSVEFRCFLGSKGAEKNRKARELFNNET